MQMIFSEREHLEGRPPWSPPLKRTTQPLRGAPGASRPAPSRYARHGQGNRWLFRGQLGARGPARVRPVRSPLWPWRLGGLRPTSWRDRPGRHGWRYAPQGVEPPASSPRLSDRCPVPAAAGAGRRHPAPGTAALVPLYWKAGPVRASVFVIKRCPLGSSQLDSWGEACWDTARWFP